MTAAAGVSCDLGNLRPIFKEIRHTVGTGNFAFTHFSTDMNLVSE